LVFKDNEGLPEVVLVADMSQHAFDVLGVATGVFNLARKPS